MEMNFRVIFGFVVVTVMVLAATFANQVKAGGGHTQYVPFVVKQEAAPPSPFDLLLLNYRPTPVL